MLLKYASLKYWSLGMVCMCSFFLTKAQESGIMMDITPKMVELAVGDSVQLDVTVKDSEGNEMDAESVAYYTRGVDRKIIEVFDDGRVKGLSGGEATIIVIRPDEGGKYLRKYVPVKVKFPAVKELQFVNLSESMYEGVSKQLKVLITDMAEAQRAADDIKIESSNNDIISVNDFKILTANKVGKATLRVVKDGVITEKAVEVVENPVVTLTLSAPSYSIRTGDVIQFKTTAFDVEGNEVTNIPLNYTFQGKSANPSYSAEGMVDENGRFVAYEPGIYSFHVSCGKVHEQQFIEVKQRDVQRDIEFVGKGSVSNVHTSDLWVWEGVDGKDYCVTGTWGADGEAYFWDVTDPANMQIVDTVKVDARTVNDVKISEDGKVCIISREGASNRKNGIVILDVTNPRDVKQHSVFDDGLTGGVHNLFIYQNHVFALSNGERYDIINIENPEKPEKVGTFELASNGHAIHDVWVENGIAYSSNWHDGVQLVDVGNGIKGGTPEKPVKIGSYAYPSGWNHAAFPYKSESTGKFYVIAGDEAFPNGINIDEEPTYPAGYLHVIDFTDMENPKEVAHYEVPGAGSHNFWIEGDVLYVANYNGGLRVVDISGDLMGNLYDQDREIASFIPADPNGRIPNAPMTWGPQPHKGHIFFSDWNSGLWSVKLQEEEQQIK